MSNPIAMAAQAIEEGDRYRLAAALLEQQGITDPDIDDAHRALSTIDRTFILDPRAPEAGDG